MTEMSNSPIPAPYSPIAQPVSGYISNYNAQTLQQAGFATDVGKDGGGTLRYPLDTPKYTLTFTISEYKRDNLNSVGAFSPAQGYPGIVMPLPSQLIDTNHVNWAEVEIGTLPGVAVNTIAGGAQNVKAGNQGAGIAQIVGGVLGAAGAAGLVGGAGIAGQLGALNGATGLTAAGLSLLGVAPNQFVTLLMKGPTYKRHKFSWTLSPTNFQEADQLREIIRTFKNAMSPNFYTVANSGPILWAFPKIFHLRLYPNSLFMYKFKPCVCDFFVANYMPGGRGAFFRDSTGNEGQSGRNAPESIQIQANFIELEYWLEGNFSADNDPDNIDQQPNGNAGDALTLVGNIGGALNNTLNNNPPDTTGPGAATSQG